MFYSVTYFEPSLLIMVVLTIVSSVPFVNFLVTWATFLMVCPAGGNYSVSADVGVEAEVLVLLVDDGVEVDDYGLADVVPFA